MDSKIENELDYEINQIDNKESRGDLEIYRKKLFKILYLRRFLFSNESLENHEMFRLYLCILSDTGAEMSKVEKMKVGLDWSVNEKEFPAAAAFNKDIRKKRFESYITKLIEE